ncbi:hypothetical protein AB0F52_38765 [Amycolatopsis sp. NPDC024027]|uniref:hypothetical protein n=1 Tax=Amycolatopsis sp. NPDC024027 TaxID=3154327 RepID=UPI0033CED638
MASLVRQAEALQAEDSAFRAEAAYWTHREADSPDGVPKIASGPPPHGHGVVSLRASLDRLFAGLGQPHTLLRIGYGYPTRLTSRRPVEDVLTHRTGPDVPAE